MGKRVLPSVAATVVIGAVALLTAASASTALSSTDTVTLGQPVPETALTCPGDLKQLMTVDYDPAGRETRDADQVAKDAATQLVPGAADGSVTGAVAYRVIYGGNDIARQVVYRDHGRVVALIALKDHGRGLSLESVAACAYSEGQKPPPDKTAQAFGLSCGHGQPEVTRISQTVDGDIAAALREANTVANVPQAIRDAVSERRFTTADSGRKQQVKVHGDTGNIIAVYTLVNHATEGTIIEAVAHCAGRTTPQS